MATNRRLNSSGTPVSCCAVVSKQRTRHGHPPAHPAPCAVGWIASIHQKMHTQRAHRLPAAGIPQGVSTGFGTTRAHTHTHTSGVVAAVSVLSERTGSFKDVILRRARRPLHPPASKEAMMHSRTRRKSNSWKNHSGMMTRCHGSTRSCHVDVVSLPWCLKGWASLEARARTHRARRTGHIQRYSWQPTQNNPRCAKQEARRHSAGSCSSDNSSAAGVQQRGVGLVDFAV
jgi:hypothetical protein